MNSKELLGKLISFPTVSRDSNLELIQFIRDYLADIGISADIIHSEDGRKANLWATIGPESEQGIVLSGHTDVVPVDGQDWHFDPFKMEEHEGRLYGRGTCDMKGYVACVLAAVPMFTKANLKRPVHLAFSYDEEVGCQGVPRMLEKIAQKPIKPLACIIGEPTRMQPILGHKGKLGMRCRVHGAACHSAYAPYGVNAIEYASSMIQHLRDIQTRLSAPEQQDKRFDPPYSTIQTGIIHGGTALNIVPDQCHFDWEVRALPSLDPIEIERDMRDYAEQHVVPEMQQKDKSTGISFEKLQAYPGLGTDKNSFAARLIAHITGRDDFATVAYGTEGGLFSASGIESVVCGPGNMDQGHKPDEFVTIEQLDICDNMLKKLCDYLI